MYELSKKVESMKPNFWVMSGLLQIQRKDADISLVQIVQIQTKIKRKN